MQKKKCWKLFSCLFFIIANNELSLGWPKTNILLAKMNGHFAFNVFIAVVKNTVVKLSMNACGDNKSRLLRKIIKKSCILWEKVKSHCNSRKLNLRSFLDRISLTQKTGIDISNPINHKIRGEQEI